MKDELITYSTAVLAKEKGFNEEADCYYMISDKGSILLGVHRDDYEPNKMVTNDEGANVAVVVTQTQLQRWLRDEHKLHIEILLTEDAPYFNFYYRMLVLGEYFTLSHDDNYYHQYEKALEDALIEALNKIPLWNKY